MTLAAGTPLKVSVAATVASLVLLLVVFELIRSRRLRERYALLWLVTGIALTVLSAWREGLNTIAGWLGVRSYPPAVLFAVGILFILAVLLHYSTVISRLSDQNVLLAQRLALHPFCAERGHARINLPGLRTANAKLLGDGAEVDDLDDDGCVAALLKHGLPQTPPHLHT